MAKCESDVCINGACVIDSCAEASGPDGTLKRCSTGANYDTCACVSVNVDFGMCVQFQSPAYEQLTDSCDLSSDCDKGQVCASFPGSSGGKACLEATSCQGVTSPPDFPTEDIPPELLGGPDVEPGTEEVWRLRTIDFQTETDERKVIWAENPVHLASVGDFILANDAGDKTTNTKCVPIRQSGESKSPGGGAVGSIPDVTYLPKGRDVYFGYDSDELLNSKPKDTCCFSLYDNEDCTGGEAWGGCGIWISVVPFDVQAFQISNCKMLLPL